MSDNIEQPSDPPEQDAAATPSGEVESQTPEATASSDSPASEHADAKTADSEAGQDAAEASSPDGTTNRFGIQIGSRRDGQTQSTPSAAKRVRSAKPKSLAPPSLPPKPTRHDRISEELQAEIDAALGGQSIDELVQGAGGGVEGEMLEAESRRRGQVVRVENENVFISLDGRHEGIAPLRQFPEPPEIGSSQEVIISTFNSEDGLYDLLVPGAAIEVGDWSDIGEGTLVEARITGSNTGGLECQVNNLRGFIPASQISLYRVENLADFVDQKMVCVVTEANPERRNLVLSRRAVLEREREESKQKLLNELEPGQSREGVVRNIRDFGAFVDLGGVDGLIHISQLSWERVNHPSDVVEEGQKVKVKIEKIDPQTGKISLSLRDSSAHPWASVQQQFAIGTVVSGVVSQIANFGAFVRLVPGVEGLVHISEIAHHRVQSVGANLKVGQEVNVKILDIDFDNQRMSLSIKQTQQAPEGPKKKTDEEEPAAVRVVKEAGGPLKGGMDRPSGGEQFGLKW